MMKRHSIISRRRLLTIMAACAGTAFLPAAASTPMRTLVWRGTALGAAATLTLHHPDEAVAQDLLDSAVAEIRRLEQIFSLYRADSAVSRLNRAGRLEAPPLELVDLLGQARGISDLTDGAFDVTLQPLWRLYADHFARADADPAGPDKTALVKTLALVDHNAVRVGSGAIGFERPGMAITLNGIAQGYITDRIANLLRRGGLDHVLIDLGEIRALGRHPDGRAWTAGIAEPDDKTRVLHTLALDDRALATSAGAGTRFEPSGRHHHLLDARSGNCTQQHASVSVLAPTATLADGLSTGFSALPVPAIVDICTRLTGVTAITLDRNGRLHSLGA